MGIFTRRNASVKLAILRFVVPLHCDTLTNYCEILNAPL